MSSMFTCTRSKNKDSDKSDSDSKVTSNLQYLDTFLKNKTVTFCSTLAISLQSESIALFISLDVILIESFGFSVPGRFVNACL